MQSTFALLLALIAIPSRAHAHGQDLAVLGLGNVAALVIVGAWAVFANETKRTKRAGIWSSLGSILLMGGLTPRSVFAEQPVIMVAANFLVPLICGMLPSVIAHRSRNRRER